MHAIAHQYWVIKRLKRRKKLRSEHVRIRIHLMSQRRATPLRIQ